MSNSEDDTYRRQIVPYRSMSIGKQLRFLCDRCGKDKATTGRKRIRGLFWHCAECLSPVVPPAMIDNPKPD